jgi:hypothetical protein
VGHGPPVQRQRQGVCRDRGRGGAVAKTNAQGFWTSRPLVPSWDPAGPVTLCEKHTLIAINAVFLIRGEKPVKTVAEGSVLFAALAAVVGQEEVLTYSETGACEQCIEEGGAGDQAH